MAVTWQIGQHFLALFVISNHYSVYGVVGAFIAVMVWFYYAGAVVFLGAEIVRASIRRTKTQNEKLTQRRKGAKIDRSRKLTQNLPRRTLRIAEV